MQPVLESHIMTHVGPGEAPASWGCDAFWEGGDPNFENCVAVFSTLYVTDSSATQPAFLDLVFNSAPMRAGEEAQLGLTYSSFDVGSVLPTDPSYFTYVRSLVRLST